MTARAPLTAGKASVAAPANIAFIKYWGARDLAEALPANASISMTLSACLSHSTVAARPEPGPDEVLLASPGGALAPAPAGFSRRVVGHLDVLRRSTGFAGSFRVATVNSFPASAGLASSASGFAALAVAALESLGLELPAGELSALARASGSASAARSVLGGFVELPAGLEARAGAHVLYPAEHWSLCDVIALIETGEKEVSSLEGHRRAPTSPYFERRLEQLPEKLARVRSALAARDLEALGPLIEEEAIDLHLIAMSSRPGIFYWAPATLVVLAELRALRAAGIGAWGTMDAGPNVHVICEPRDAAVVADRLASLPGVRSILSDGVGSGPAPAADLF
ncbi:MAG TPA: diphosphomevalonate decarboxylase [Thermoanaerobaculia bacterium]|nr:diphosphomevalonate decarboxylase [Thermoanaerobaculia bacterium]